MKMNLRRSALALCLAGSGAVACGGPEAKSAEVRSMPAYPATNAKDKNVEAKAEEPSKPKDAKSICARAGDVKAASASRSFSLPDEKVAALGTSVGSGKAKDSTYGMADLQALEKKGSWEELLQHAEDVAPSQRSAAWEKTVEKASIGYMDQLMTSTASFEGIFTSQSLLKRYPHLLKSESFMKKRGEAGKSASEICLRESYRGQHCIDMMKDFLKTWNTNADVGFAFGKITRKNQNHYVAVPFFKWALDQKKDATMCGDDDLKLAVVAGLGLPPDYENADGARKISDTCFDTLKPAIQKELIENASSYYRDNACAVLRAKGAL